MFELGYDSVSRFCNDLGANYMQVYYTYNGQNNTISSELIAKILNKYPQVRRQFIETGEGPALSDGKTMHNQPVSTQLQTPENNQVTLDDMFRLLDRLTTLFEKVQKREEKVEQLQERTENLLEIIIKHEGITSDMGLTKKNDF